MPAPPDSRTPVPRTSPRPALLVIAPARIKLARLSRGVSLRELGEKANRSAVSMWNLENGVTRAVDQDVAIAVALKLDLPLEEVFATPPASRASNDESHACTPLGGEPA